MANILDAVGIDADDDVRHYLDHMRIRSVGALAHMFADGEALSTWVTCFTTAVTLGNSAKTLHLRPNNLVLGTYGHQHPVFPEYISDTGHNRGQGSQGTTTRGLRGPPTTIQQINGTNRKFPEETIILGADRAIACRMRHEHHRSKHYTAPALGEITFTAMGTINNSAKDRRSERTRTLDSNNSLVESSKDSSPQNLMMILDASRPFDGPGSSYRSATRPPPTRSNRDPTGQRRVGDLHLATGDENADGGQRRGSIQEDLNNILTQSPRKQPRTLQRQHTHYPRPKGKGRSN